MSSIRLIVLQTHPIQYWAPLYSALANQDEFSVNAIYLTDSGVKPYYDSGFGQTLGWDLPLLDNYEYLILKQDTDIRDLNFWTRHDQSLIKVLDKEKPDWILVDGYASRMNWIALQWAVRHGARIAYTSDSNNSIKRGHIKSFLKHIPLRYFFGHVSAFFSPSLSNQEYLLSYGVNPAKIHRYPYPIDFKRFKRNSSQNQDYDFVWAGKLTDRKRALDFVLALKYLKAKGYTNIRASLIGDGELKNIVLEESKDLIHAENLVFNGFINQSSMPLELGKGKIFVFTSEREPYGLVATEAAATGAALIVANGIGCVGPHSSAQPGVNTLTYPVGDIAKLTDAMEKLLVDHSLRRQMQRASILISSQHDVSNAASIISSALKSPCQS